MRKNSRRCSGQVLVIAVLVVSLVLLSTQLYIYEVGESLRVKSVHVNDFVLAVRLGSHHAVTSSLANISLGGADSVLRANLERWAAFTGGLYQFGKPVLTFTLQNTPPYVNGTYLSWDTDGLGVTSAYTNFTLSLLDSSVNVHSSYAVNVTTLLVLEGVYRQLPSLWRRVNVTCNVFNEGKPALSENITVLYLKSGSWLRADTLGSYSFTDYGNGTYLVSFEEEYLPLESVAVSAQIHDLRGIYVQANATCTEAP